MQAFVFRPPKPCIGRDEGESVLPRPAQDVTVAQKIAETQFAQTVLACAEKLAHAPKTCVRFREREAVAGAYESLETIACLVIGRLGK